MELLQRTDKIYLDCDDEVLIRITNLCVWTKEEKSYWRSKIIKPKIMILRNVTGYIRDGDFAAVIGPSGAGKTSLLVSLAGKCTLPSSGDVTLNHRNVELLQNGVVEMVPQFEVFMEHLTVAEHLVFMIELKLGCSNKPTNRILLNTLMSELQLKVHAYTQIKALSGGEKKLLSLATSLLSNPRVLICDEPTTGLDSYNASLVISVLKKLSLGGTTVLCSVHQPSSDLFSEFSSILLMAEGRLLMYGTQEECTAIFNSINLRCPKNYNPAEFYVRAVSSTHTNANIRTIRRTFKRKFHEVFQVTSPAKASPVSQHKDVQISQRFWLKQVQLLLWRNSLSFKRDVRNHVIQLCICILISSLVIGTCYIGITGTTQQGIQNMRGFLWLLCSEVSFNISYNALYAFEEGLTLFRRETGLYKTSAYFVSTFISLIPRCIIWPAVFTVVAASAVSLPNGIITALEFTAVLIFTSIASVAYGLGMGALFTSSGAMGDIMPCVDLPLLLMSGAFLRLASLPALLHPLQYLSHFYYCMHAVSNVYWRQIPHIDCPSNFTTTCVEDGLTVLIENGYDSENFILEDTLGLLGIAVIWNCLGYYGLKREEKKGFIY